MSRIVLALLAFILLVPTSQAQTAEDLFQQAVRVERLSGNTEAAIALYEQIVEEHSDERELVAKALVRLGNAYELQGSKQAANSYRLVLEMYAELEPMASEAASGLARVTSTTTQEQFEIAPGNEFIPPTADGFQFWGAGFSDDGSLIVTDNTNSKSIVVYDRRTNESKHYDYAPGASFDHKWVEYSRLSPNNKTVAFGSWVGEGDHDGEIRLLNLDTGKARPLLQLADYFREIYGVEILRGNPQVHDWTASGDSVLAYLWASMVQGRDVGYNDLAMISVKDGGFRQVLGNGAFNGFGWELTCLSTDDRYVFADLWSGDEAYIGRIDVNTGNVDKWRKGEQGQQIALYGCTNRGKILYSSGRFGVASLFAGDQEALGDGVQDERISALPENASAILSSQEGDVGYYGQEVDTRLLLFEVDPISGRVNGDSQTLNDRWVTIGNFSPDGSKVLFHRPGSGGDLVVRDIQTGAETTTQLGNRHAAFRWAMDGKHAMAIGLGNQREAFLYDTEDGELLGSIVVTDSTRDTGPGLTPTSIMMANLSTGCFYSQDVITRDITPYSCLPPSALPVQSLRTAEDMSKSVAIAGDSVSAELYLITSSDEEPTLIYTEEYGDEPPNWIQWAGTDHLVLGRRAGEGNPLTISSLFSLDTKTGETREVYSEIQDVLRIQRYHFSPDGRHMVALVDNCPACFGAPDGLTIMHRALDINASSN